MEHGGHERLRRVSRFRYGTVSVAPGDLVTLLAERDSLAEALADRSRGVVSPTGKAASHMAATLGGSGSDLPAEVLDPSYRPGSVADAFVHFDDPLTRDDSNDPDAEPGFRFQGSIDLEKGPFDPESLAANELKDDGFDGEVIDPEFVECGDDVPPLRRFSTGAVRSKDADDTRYDLISPIALEEIARVCAEGSAKYGDFNWEKGMPAHDLLNHALRHMYKFLAGDRSEPHLPHAAWGLMAAIHSVASWPDLNEPYLRGPGCKPPEGWWSA